MKVILLGTAAGGGCPQWNCACPVCTSGAPARSQDGVAVSANGRDWYLVNASPDIRAQILATPELAAGPGPRQTPVRGVLLTDAELDHTLGLMMLREGGGLRVWASRAVLGALDDGFPVRGILGGYSGWEWSELAAGGARDIGGLRVTAFAVGDKRPKYARTSAEAGPWVVAYRFEDPATGGAFVYAPCLAGWPDGFDAFTAGAGYVLLDGTFHTAREFGGATGAAGTTAPQAAMGHLPVVGEGASLEHVRRLRATRPETRWAYTHLNNTNAMADPRSEEHLEVRGAGAQIPADGTRLEL
ncbi:pyrroloquinoline quinone biosynthesis protein PqqB [Streptomyces sp. NBC_00539]|uniref:pyrroloquinoline quinone biosynthesis protein PqqB n=1 Tax=Streptomyces sp. NBC_00539 TaxID=2975770 RepID=UPI002E815EEA|nr:pyrroloquinoline quinone biosynthesis protein PqqB [Streptomyces sp. NBC_00539]WUC64029.1 pyrroloquinoline quinone biosynthesis protein PqqB [Streptomyces sp. NBC_00539]